MTNSEHDSLLGRTIGQYQILARIGGGGMGVVYTARASKLGRVVALKFLPAQWNHDETAKQRFVREAQAASATNHPNICTIHDIETADDGQLFIVMAYYEGETLKKRLEAEPLPIDAALDIATQVADGLAKAHAQGVVHRDIKPGNLMLTEEGVRILDFGLATFADAVKLTTEHAPVGTVAYMSPEQFRGEQADARADVWATGAVLYEMLTGHAPFRGSHAEAIGYAVRNEQPMPIREERPEVPEEVEQLVFRALHKEASVRYASGRELARALRQVRGHSIPIDLRTAPVAVPTVAPSGARRPNPWLTGGVRIAGICALMLAGGIAWALSPVERVPVAVVPIVNQTGYAELDDYRLALTEQLIGALIESRTVHVFPFPRLLPVVRPFRGAGSDISSRQAVQAIAVNSGARVLIVPSLVRENGAWKARVVFQSPETATEQGVYETPAVLSSLSRDAAFDVTMRLAGGVDAYFVKSGPLKGAIADVMTRLVGRRQRPLARLKSLDAAAHFERAMDAVDRQEYSLAMQSVNEAVSQDPRSPLIHAWRSRIASVLRRDEEAASAAEQALHLVSDPIGLSERVFVQAVTAEVTRDFQMAEGRYRELISDFSDEPVWRNELAAFFDRRTRAADAAEMYLSGLKVDSRQPGVYVELCRLYGPNQLNEALKAKEHGKTALTSYQTLGNRDGEALARMCLADVLRTGTEAERQQATTYIDGAIRLLDEAKSVYQLARALSYSALVAGVRGDLQQSVALGERALTQARASGNATLVPLVLMNLGVANALRGNRREAVDRYRESARLFESLGEDQRAAQAAVNAASIVINNGGEVGVAVRDVENALGVFRRDRNRQFEVFSLRLLGNYHRYAGRYSDAIELLNRALAITRERDLGQNVPFVLIDRAAAQLDRGDYAAARADLIDAVGDGTGPDSLRAGILLAGVDARIGDLDGATRHLTIAQESLARKDDRTQRRLLQLMMGARAFEADDAAHAQAFFSMAVDRSAREQMDAVSVEALVYLGLVQVEGGHVAQARLTLLEALDQARRMGRVALEAAARVFLARTALATGDAHSAAAALDDIPGDSSSRTIGPEIRAQSHYWRSEVLLRRGDNAGARAEREAARTVILQLRDSLPPEFRHGFSERPIIRILLR